MTMELPEGAAKAAPFSIRPVEPADIPAITAIYAGAVLHGTATFELEPPDAAEMERRRAGLAAGGHPYLVAVRDGAVLGYAYAGPYRPRPAYRWTVEDSVYLAPTAQGQGVGTALLRALVDAAAEAGFRQMVAVIGDSAHVASIRMHEAAGFTTIGNITRVGWKFGRWLDTVLMQRELGPGASAPAPGQDA